ncbi:hypothetical protein CJ179_49620 [Rhodococcus sp. ACS1]|uniref:hypothetical protein n=1 Tax=Rhodococcus sp. ACS1 TaxID=2028570 RepID=UPI000BB0D8C5|nr:hypothetical protein [Rhodococcus sp. ACS1]PBC35118.1 hypothetical protein CJ179_49620 [Rhodococcus sp. ACS1]
MTTHRSHNPAARWVWCAQCRQRSYLARGDAKKVRKQRHHGAKGLAVFACPHNPGQFHVGLRPAALGNGTLTRTQLRRNQLGLFTDGAAATN